MKDKVSSKGKYVLKRIHKIKPFIQASFSITKKRCGRPTCKCAKDGPIHESALLTWKENKKTCTLYVPKELRKDVAEWVEEGKLLRRLMAEMSRVQRAVLIGTRKSKRA